MTRFYVDTEFIEDGHTIDLLSIGLVTEDGNDSFYVENADADHSKAHPWVQENVIPHLRGAKWSAPRADVAILLRGTVDALCAGDGSRPEFWSWCSAYDWVAICQLYGPMVDKPEGWPSYCRDLQQELDRHGLSDDEVPPHPGTAHDALADARWHRDIHLWLLKCEDDLERSVT